MTDDMSDEDNTMLSTDVFARAPEPEEIDQRLARDPWLIRHRLTYEAYATRCRIQGRQPDLNEWSNHLQLTTDELAELNNHVEALRVTHVAELANHFIIREYGNKARVGWFDERGELCTMSYSEFKNSHIEKMREIDDGEGKKRIPLVSYWLQHPLTTRFARVDYRLGVAQSAMPDVLNLWRGWPHNLQPGWEDYRLTVGGSELITNGAFDRAEMPRYYCDMFLEHMRNNMCGGDEAVLKYLLGWIADALWNPGPCETAIVLTGPQGSGKTFWVESIMEFFGIHAITLGDPEQLVGNFNKHLANKSLVFADEAFFAGNRKHANRLKTLITGPDIFIEPKGVDGFIAPKRFRLVFASNDEHVVQAERDDRRNLVLTVDAGERNQDHEYFDRMHREWNEGGRRAFFRWLTGSYWRNEVAEEKFRMWRRPVTAALQIQKDLSLAKPQMAVFNMLRDGDIPGLYKLNEKHGTVFVATVALIEANHLGPEAQRAVGQLLGVLAGPKAKSAREILGEGFNRRQYRGFWLPPLEECRRRWEKFMGRSVAWPDATTSWTDALPLEDSMDAAF